MDYKEANRSVVDIYLTKEYWKPEYQDLFAKDFVLDLPSAPPGMPQHMDAFDARQYREWLLRTVSGYTSEVQEVYGTPDPEMFWAVHQPHLLPHRTEGRQAVLHQEQLEPVGVSLCDSR